MKHQIKVFKLLGLLGVLALSLPLFPESISQAQLQATPSDRNQENGEPNPTQERSNLLNSYHQAIAMLSAMPEDTPVEFPLRTNSPVLLGQISDDTGTPSEANNGIAQGVVDQNGQTHNFTPGNLVAMFRTAASNGGNLPRINMTPETQENLLADAQGVFFQAKRIPVIDLIVFNPQNRRRYVVRRVNVNAVDRDALNAVLTKTLRRSNKISEEK